MTQDENDDNINAQKSEEFSSVVFWMMACVWVCVAGITWPISLMVSVMMFDAPGSEDSPLSYLSAISFLTIPAAAFIAPFLAYTFKKKGETKKVMAAFFGLPAIPVGALILFLVLSEVFCGGKTSCG